MNAVLSIETSVHKDDKTGREVLTFTPVAKFSPIASGELRFASWQAWLDEPDTISIQRERAYAAAVQAIATFVSPAL